MTAPDDFTATCADDPFEIGKRFAEQVTGTTICNGPPPADSPLGRLLARCAPDAPTQADFAQLHREYLEREGLA